MARNKHPEETINKIIDVSLKLFMEKGYENTSIQDIIDNLGGLTKGAIYHHFKSKEEIFMAVANKIHEETTDFILNIVKDKTLSGFEKLQKMFYYSLESSSQEKMASLSVNLLMNPQFLSIQLQSTINDIVPLYIQPTIEEAISDGSIKTDYPKELSEVIMILSNIWLNPMIFKVSPNDMVNKCMFFKQLLEGLGVNLIDERIINGIKRYSNLYI